MSLEKKRTNKRIDDDSDTDEDLDIDIGNNEPVNIKSSKKDAVKTQKVKKERKK